MTAFVLRRILWTIPVVILVILLTFVMMKAIPGNPFRRTDRPVPASIQRNLEAKFHLDDPWYEQYAQYVKGVFTFDLGPSMVLRGRTTNQIVKDNFPTSIELGLLAFAWAILIGVPAGIIAALRPNSIFDYFAMFFSNIGFALPSFLVATLLIYFVSVKAGWVPTSGWGEAWQPDSRKLLPSLALSLVPMAYFARLVRASMLETMQQDYIRTAKAKGLRWRRVVGVHVMRNSLIPAITAAGPLLGYIITGSFIIELIFAIPGIGTYYVTAVEARDYSVVLGLTVLLSVIIIVANLIVDILHGFLDPRIREQVA